MRRLLCLIIGVISAPAIATQWVEVGGSDNGSRTAAFSTDVDLDSIGFTGQYRKVWIRARYEQVQKGGVSTLRQIYYVSCSENKYQVTQQNTFSTSGALLKSISAPFTEAAYMGVPPESVAGAIVQKVCQWRPKQS